MDSFKKHQVLCSGWSKHGGIKHGAEKAFYDQLLKVLCIMLWSLIFIISLQSGIRLPSWVTYCTEERKMLRTECLCSPQIHMLKPYPQYDGIRRWGLWEVIRIRRGHESRTLMNGISALFRVTRKLASALFLSCEDTMRNWQLANQKRAHQEPDHADTRSQTSSLQSCKK